MPIPILLPRRAIIDDAIVVMSWIGKDGMIEGNDIGRIGGALLREKDRGDIAGTRATIAMRTGADRPEKIREVTGMSAGGIDHILDRGAGLPDVIVIALAMTAIVVLLTGYPLHALDLVNGLGRNIMTATAPVNTTASDIKNQLQNQPTHQTPNPTLSKTSSGRSPPKKRRLSAPVGAALTNPIPATSTHTLHPTTIQPLMFT